MTQPFEPDLWQNLVGTVDHVSHDIGDALAPALQVAEASAANGSLSFTPWSDAFAAVAGNLDQAALLANQSPIALVLHPTSQLDSPNAQVVDVSDTTASASYSALPSFDDFVAYAEHVTGTNSVASVMPVETKANILVAVPDASGLTASSGDAMLVLGAYSGAAKIGAGALLEFAGAEFGISNVPRLDWRARSLQVFELHWNDSRFQWEWYALRLGPDRSCGYQFQVGQFLTRLRQHHWRADRERWIAFHKSATPGGLSGG